MFVGLSYGPIIRKKTHPKKSHAAHVHKVIIKYIMESFSKKKKVEGEKEKRINSIKWQNSVKFLWTTGVADASLGVVSPLGLASELVVLPPCLSSPFCMERLQDMNNKMRLREPSFY